MLNEHGVRGIFGPGTPTEEIVSFIRENAPARAA
jgi:methylmalonyl-CoA mutase cobalamin-binding subunit